MREQPDMFRTLFRLFSTGESHFHTQKKATLHPHTDFFFLFFLSLCHFCNIPLYKPAKYKVTDRVTDVHSICHHFHPEKHTKKACHEESLGQAVSLLMFVD